LCSFILDYEKHLGIAALRIIPWVKSRWRVESAEYKEGGCTIYAMPLSLTVNRIL
jgi:hypothetical protein